MSGHWIFAAKEHHKLGLDAEEYRRYIAVRHLVSEREALAYARGEACEWGRDSCR